VIITAYITSTSTTKVDDLVKALSRDSGMSQMVRLTELGLMPEGERGLVELVGCAG